MVLFGGTLLVTMFAVLYVFSRVEWKGLDHAFRLRWVIVHVIPFGWLTLRFDEVDEVRPYGFWRDRKIWAQFYGRIWPAPRGRVLIRLKRDSRRLVKAYVITPKDPDAFVAWMRTRIRGP
jgi:hypothetical protein